MADGTNQAASEAGGATAAATAAGTSTTTGTTADQTLLGGAAGATGGAAAGTSTTGSAGSTDAAKTEAAKTTAAVPAEIELKLPTGFDPKDATLGEFKSIAKDAGLKSEQAQKFFDLYAKAQDKAAEPIRQAVAEHQSEQKAWQDAVRKDADIGGAKFDASLKAANGVLARFGSPELSEYLRSSGAGNNPHLVKAFVKFAQAISEDTTAGANGAAPVTPSADALLRAQYPSMFKS